MKSKTPQSYRRKAEKQQRSASKQYRETKTVERRVYPSTPPENRKNYLTDEEWDMKENDRILQWCQHCSLGLNGDILPKTDYTYAKSGSYSPRFFGRKYVSPNMSRYRLGVKGRGQESDEAEFSDEGEVMHIHDYNDEYYEDDFDDEIDYDDDRASNASYETVLEDGMSLRSGKNLQLMREIEHEHEDGVVENIPNTSKRGSTRKNNNTVNSNLLIERYDVHSMSKKFSVRQQQNERQMSMSEQKSYRNKNSSRNHNLGYVSGNSEYSNQNTDRYRRRTVSSYTNGYDTSSLSRNGGHIDNRYVNSRTVRKTLEFDETDSGVKEKAALEIPEKMLKSKSQETSTKVLNHLYGLDPTDSDTEFSDNGTETDYTEEYNISERSQGQGHRGQGHRSYTTTTTTTTTVITTVTESFRRFTQPVLEQTWRYVGQPLWTYVGHPVWYYILHPILSVISTVTSTIVVTTWETLFGESGIISGAVDALSVGIRKSNAAGPFNYISSAFMWILRKTESFIMQFVLLDVWLLSRRRHRGCCFCLPIILLLPFIIALASNRELWSGAIFGNSTSSMFSFPSFSYYDRPAPKIPDNVPFDKDEFFSQLNREVKVWLLQHQQLQSANQLTVADVEAIVHRILQKELASLKDEMAQAALIRDQKQTNWKTNHEERIENIVKQYNSLLVNIQNLESSVSQQKDAMATKASSDFSQHALLLAGLEEKLSAQKAQLDDLERQFGGLLVTMKDCCKNETFYAALVKDGVDAILKERMAGYASGTANDAFSEWLKLNTVNQADNDAKLAALASDLRADVLAMIKALEEKQQQYHQELQQLHEEKQVNQQYMVNMGSGDGIDEQIFQQILNSTPSRKDNDAKLAALASDVRADVLAMIKALEEKQQQYHQELQLQEEKQVNQQYMVNMGSDVGIDEQKVKLLIEAALLRYSADRIGIPDYALESAGGTIVSTRCSETYYRKTALLSVFGIPLWYSSNSPRTIIQPEVLPGQCWAFSGAQGYVVLKTSTLITPSGFTLEHISKSLSPSGKIDTAPKDFTVIGLESESDQTGISLGNYTYTDDDRPLQYFPVQLSTDKLKPFYLYELRILDNHGNIHFTCLYRFRIHGKPYQY